MASRSKRRRGGHPAKIAARRERERARRERSRDPLRRTASSLAREASTLQTALEAELWASTLLGTLWARRDLLAVAESAGIEVGAPLVSELARIGGEGALAALIAIGELAETELGPIAQGHAERLQRTGVRAPGWGEAIRHAEILGTAVVREDIYDDGITVLVEARHADGERRVVGVYIDHNLGGAAKDIFIADSIAAVSAVAAAGDDEHQIRVEPIAPAEAGARINDAIDVTDTQIAPPVSRDFEALRALALLRAAELPGGRVEIAEPEPSRAERDSLRDGFLDSPEGLGFDPDGDEAYVATLAIDYACDYQCGGPLRWSPVVVELFMADWLPRKVLADRATFESVPRALGAWVRYAGRRRGIPEWAIERTAASIAGWTDEMFARLDGPETRGPTMEFLTAAQDAGVDLTDREALASFVAGWNARSERP